MWRVTAIRFSQPLRAYHTTAVKAALTAPKEQPWKAFWPPKKDNYTAEEQAKMPWLTWKPNPAKPDEKPWRQWMLADQSTVVRRGASPDPTAPDPDEARASIHAR